MRAEKRPVPVPEYEVVLTMSQEEAAQLRTLMGVNLSIPRVCNTEMGYDEGKVRNLLRVTAKALGEAGVESNVNALR